MTAVIDTGVLYALVDAASVSHEECVDAIQAERDAIIVPVSVLPDVCHLISSRLGAQREAAFLRYLVDSDWRIESLGPADVSRIAALLAEHADAGIGFVKAAVAVIAERMGARRIYTLDRRHFDLIRPTHVDRFELLPPR
jgi:predicted nucleic acid-binding protein